MKKFSCGDVVPDCQASWESATEEDILSKVAAHAAAEHGLAKVPAELVSAVRANIVTVD